MLSQNFQKNNERDVLTTESMEKFEEYKKSHSEIPIIGVHSGVFHADEVLASLLIKFHPNYPKSCIIRSRNQEILNKCDIVCDVGGIINPKTLRFDHHMSDFKEVFDEKNEKFKEIKLSSAGLIFKYLGKEILENILKKNDLYEKNKEHINEMITHIYSSFILIIDANDNGINAYPSNVIPKFIDSTNFSNRIARLNPEWYLKDVDVNLRFKQAWDIAEEELNYHIMKYAKGYFLAYDIVEDSVKKFLDKEYFILDRFVPWKKILYDIEKKYNIQGKFLFVVSERESESDDKFSVTTIPKNEGSFEFRKGLPKKWRGLRNEELEKVSGIKDMVFVHSSGFIGFMKNKDAAMKCLEIALKTEE